MSEVEQTPPVSAPKWSRMPAATRLELEVVVDAHLTKHQSHHYELLRDDPRFSPWTGTHLGYRGEKYLDRVIARVKETQEQRRRIARGIPQKATKCEPSPAREASCPVGPAVGRPRKADGATYGDLQKDLFEQRAMFNHAMAACFRDDGEVDDWETYRAFAADIRVVDKAIMELRKQYPVLMEAELRQAMFKRIGSEFKDDPERGTALIRDLNAMSLGASGLALFPEAPE